MRKIGLGNRIMSAVIRTRNERKYGEKEWRDAPAATGPRNEPIDKAMDNVENVLPYRDGPLSCSMSDVIAGKMIPLDMPMTNSRSSSGTGQPAASP